MANMWLNNGLPADLCAKEPRLHDYGFYRKLNNGKYDFISFCDPNARKWFGIYGDDLSKMLDKYLPENRQGN